MEKVKCEYCGEYYEGEYQSVLDNGCPACPACVAKEEASKRRKDLEQETENENI